jgi:N-acetylglucosaminyldiphosphoundecaprenol N-acetyl-beta-D-mannosaminyltransferase
LPLVKGLAWINDMNQDRISGPDMLPELLREASFANLKVLFYGSTNIVLDKIDAFCQVQFPNLKVVGLISPPFRKLTDDEQTTYINKINESEANIVFVALGCPKQEMDG